MKRLTPLLLVLCTGICLARAAESTPASSSLIAVTDLLKIKQVEAPALSPDGRTVVYVLRSIEAKAGAKDDWSYRTQLWLAPVDGSAAPRQLTFGANASQPTWSPQGDRIAFVRADNGQPQVFVLPLAGGDAVAITHLDTGATSPRWSPDGQQLLVSTDLSRAQVRDKLEKAGRPSTTPWNHEKPGRTANDTANWGLTKDDKPAKADPDGSLQERREWLAQNETGENPRTLDRLNFLDETGLAPDLSFSQFYVVDARGETEPTPVLLGYENFGAGEWMPDGKRIVCLGQSKPTLHPDRDDLISVYLIDLVTHQATMLSDLGELSATGTAVPSPDGKWIAFPAHYGRAAASFDQAKVALLSVNGGAPLLLTEKLDRPSSNLAWSPDGKFIYFTAMADGAFPLYRVTAAGGVTEQLTDKQSGVRAFDVAGSSLVYSLTTPTNPWELYAAKADATESRILTTHNSSWIKGKKLTTFEHHSFVNSIGLTIDYWTAPPTVVEPGKKYPLLLEIHGGAGGMWGPGEVSMWLEFQFFAARGYAIVFANPRGSQGYGKEFQHASYRDWGPGPSSDILTAVDHAAAQPFVDKNRMVLTGGSYGGYLTAWIIGHDQRFKAAVAQRGAYELSTFFGEGNAWLLVPHYWGGYPWQKDVRAFLDRDSPLTYVENIHTPLLIQHGDNDRRTGFVQSEMLFKSLKVMGRDVEVVRYPNATHEMSRSGPPKQRIDSLVRYEEFFRRYIGEN